MTRAIEDMSLVSHACVIPDSDEHLWEVTSAWMSDGLAAGDKVVHFEDGTVDLVFNRLAEDGVPFREAMADGQLVIVPGEGTRAALAAPAEAIEHLIRGQIDEVRAEGWPGMRFSGDSGAALHGPGGLAKVIDYETRLDQVFQADSFARMLCRFDPRQFDEEAVAAMREVHGTELITPAVYDDTLLRITHSGPAAVRLAGEVDHSNRLQIRRMLTATLDRALRSHSAPTDITLDLASLRFVDVAGAVGLVHAAEEFPSTHRLVLTGVRPRVLRVLDRCGAPFAAQLVVTPAEA